MSILQALGHFVVVLGLVFIAFGILGIYRFKEFFQRLLVASKIDTVGTITVIIGMIMIHGLSLFSARLLLIMGIIMFLGPLSTHIVGRSAYSVDKEEDE
ncbi:MAG: monovalent cation/H(+) antiporter subunit G [Defluviitaleaceae bacterium]|nr:monovalent cation/H(+) antiporter subunit G [Defluviitaleaceae bacterium]